MLTETKSDPIYPDSPVVNSFQNGLEFQDFVCYELAKQGIILQNLASRKYQYTVGENLQGFEIKMDSRFLETGRLSIEIAEKTKASNVSWIPSGIYRIDNSWLYIQGNYQRIYIFAKSILLGLHKSGKYKDEESHGTVRKFYLSLEEADKYCAKRIEPLP